MREADWDLRPGYLAAAFALCSVWFLVRPIGWKLIIDRFGRPVPFAAIYRVYRSSEMSRYVPGAVWQFLSRIYLIKTWGVAATACLAATMVDLVLATLAAVVPATAAMDAALPDLGRYQRIVLIAFPVFALCVVQPRIFNAWAGFIARQLGQPWERLRIGWMKLTSIWLMYVAGWLLLATGVAFFVHGVIRIEGADSVYIGSSYAVAWLIGTLFMVAPAGMGIREGALGLLLMQLMPRGPAFTLAVAVRLFLALEEIVWTIIGMAVLPRPEPTPSDAPPSETT